MEQFYDLKNIVTYILIERYETLIPINGKFLKNIT